MPFFIISLITLILYPTKPEVKSIIGTLVINLAYHDPKYESKTLCIGQLTTFTPVLYLEPITKSIPFSVKKTFILNKSLGL